MNWFRDVKIATKLLGSFVVVAFIAGVIGWMGLSGARNLAAVADDVYKNQLVSIAELETANNEFLMARLALREAFLVEGADRREKEKLSGEHIRLMEEHIAKYKQTQLSDEEKKLIPQLDLTVPRYRAARESVFAHLARNDEKAALTVMNTDGKVAGDELDAVLDNLSQVNARLAEANNKQTEITAAGIQRNIVTFIIVGVVLAVVLGFMISRMIANPVRMLGAAADALALGDINVQLPPETKDEIGGLSASFRAMADNVRNRSEAAQKIAAGDMSIKVTPKSERDVLGQGLQKCLKVLNELMRQMDEMARQHDAGDIDAMINAHDFEGDYRKVAQGINNMVGGHITVKKKAMACIGEFGRGNFEAPMEKLPGKKAFINETIEQVRANLKALIVDANMLVEAAVEGRLATRADAGKHQGDFRKIVDGVNRTLDAVIGPLNDFAKVLDCLASGDLTVTAAKDYAGEFEKFKKSVNTVAIQVRSAMQQIGHNTSALVASAEELNKVSQQMSASADETAAQANVVSAASDQVSKNVQTVATGADEMGASIKEIAKNTAEATKVAIAAVKTAESTNQTIEKLGQSSAEIGQVIKVITSIAQQTNLLALNATIEAARAGEAGKGFAVVANEVKELAKETAKATEDISQKIEAIQSDTKGAVSAIAQISAVINQINDIQNTIASAVEEQSATTNEISRNLAEAAKGAVDITKNIGGVAEAARSTTAGAVDTQKSAQSLERMSAELQELVSQFKYDEQKAGGSVRTSTGSRSKANGKYVAPVAEPAYPEAVH